MDAYFEVMRGARAGERISLAPPAAVVGRSAEADLRFDPGRDLAVSARHALLFFAEGAWYVRDLESRNGTLVNDRRVSGDVRLAAGDRVAFGEGGPVIEFRPGGTSTTEDLPTVERLRLQLARRTVRLGGLAVVLTLALASVLGASLYLGAVKREQWARERASLRLMVDSLERTRALTVESLEGQLSTLTSTLARSRVEVRGLEEALRGAQAGGGEETVESLRRRLQAASAALRRQQLAASLDFEALQRRSRPAVARVFVEYANGEVATGTAFAVLPDATLVTSRHVVLDPAGEPPRRIAIQFSDSEQVWPARLLRTAASADLAVVKVDQILGDVPVVPGLNLRPDTLAPGSPVALIGFALGGERTDADRRLARPLLSAGILRLVSRDTVRLQGYGAVGASGSPVLDARGEVVAVLFGGRPGEEGGTLFAIPAPLVERLLREIR